MDNPSIVPQENIVSTYIKFDGRVYRVWKLRGNYKCHIEESVENIENVWHDWYIKADAEGRKVEYEFDMKRRNK